MSADDRMVLSNFTMEIATSLATAAIGGVVIYGAMEHSIGWGDAGPEAGYFPFWIGLIVMAASFAVLVQTVVQKVGAGETFLTREQSLRVASFAVPVVLFVPVSLYLGLYVATAIYLLATTTLQGKFPLVKAVPIAIAAPVVMFVVFERWFQTPLLKGPLEAALGLY
jgi:hypothetical protein